MSDILGFVLEAARGRRWRRRWTRRWRKVVRWVVGLGKGGGGGWLALLICKTANLRTLCFTRTPLRSTHSPPPSLAMAHLLALSAFPSRSLSALPRFDLSSFLAPVSRPLQTRTPIHIVALSLSPSSRAPPVSLCLRSLIPAVRPVSSTYLL